MAVANVSRALAGNAVNVQVEFVIRMEVVVALTMGVDLTFDGLLLVVDYSFEVVEVVVVDSLPSEVVVLEVSNSMEVVVY